MNVFLALTAKQTVKKLENEWIWICKLLQKTKGAKWYTKNYTKTYLIEVNQHTEDILKISWN
jgi:hypothetical protein